MTEADYVAEHERRRQKRLQRLRVAVDRIDQGLTLGREPFTKAKERVYLEAVSLGLSHRMATEAAGCGYGTPYERAKVNPKFAERWQAAKDAGTWELEERLDDIALTGDPSSMATVRAAEIRLRGMSARYTTGAARATVKMERDADGAPTISAAVSQGWLP